MKTKGSGQLQKKFLACLLAGISMSLSRSPKHHWKILVDDLPMEFAKIDISSLEYGLHRLYKAKFIKITKNEHGSYIPYLTSEGRAHAKLSNLDSISISKPAKWDLKWRLVIFDIPETMRKKRNTLRFHLKRMGFM